MSDRNDSAGKNHTDRYAFGDRVLVESALSFAQVIEVQHKRSGTYYVVQFPEGDTLWRHECELTPA